MKTEIIKKEMGFTLVELLVVIAIIGLLAGLFIPVINLVRRDARIAETVNSGRTIYQAILTTCINDANIMPKSTGDDLFATSTEYWKWIVSNEVVDATFDAFSAFGLPEYRGLDETKFTSAQNAWCIAADVNELTRSMTPVMFTRNLDIDNLSTVPALTDTEPFGVYAAVVVMKDGRALKIKNKDLEEGFNPAEVSKPVLRP